MVEDAEEQVRSLYPILFLFPTSHLIPSLHFHQEKSADSHSEVGSQAAESDYDVDEEYDNDYAEDYFDNGEGDDVDDLGGGGGGEEGGGMYLVFLIFRVVFLVAQEDFFQAVTTIDRIVVYPIRQWYIWMHSSREIRCEDTGVVHTSRKRLL